MDCFQDFCLACDKASDGPYCSQACRLADLERASGSSSPTSPTFSSHVQWPSTAKSSKTTPFLPSQTQWPSTRTSYFSQQSTVQQDARALSPSSSRTSLSSTSSSSACPTQHLSYQVQHQLNSYYHAFEQSKASKRRSSTR